MTRVRAGGQGLTRWRLEAELNKVILIPPPGLSLRDASGRWKPGPRWGALAREIQSGGWWDGEGCACAR